MELSRQTRIRITVEEVRNAVEEEIGKAPREARSEMLSAIMSLDNALFWLSSAERRLSGPSD